MYFFSSTNISYNYYIIFSSKKINACDFVFINYSIIPYNFFIICLIKTHGKTNACIIFWRVYFFCKMHTRSSIETLLFLLFLDSEPQQRYSRDQTQHRCCGECERRSRESQAADGFSGRTSTNTHARTHTHTHT